MIITFDSSERINAKLEAIKRKTRKSKSDQIREILEAHFKANKAVQVKKEAS